MSVNPFFQRGLAEGTPSEQRLIEDLTIEAIQIRGHDVYYMPRTSVKPDMILGEDILSAFTQLYPIEMYVANVQGWEGNSELMTKFGIVVNDQATFVVSRLRWKEAVALQTTELQLPNRPAEGDLLYFPLTRAFFEIKFVNHLDPFFQLSKIFVYQLQCELFNYSSEAIITGNEEIDDRAAEASRDQYRYGLRNQTGGLVLNQLGEPIITQEYPEEADGLDDTVRFEEETATVIDFNVHDPFGEL